MGRDGDPRAAPEGSGRCRAQAGLGQGWDRAQGAPVTARPGCAGQGRCSHRGNLGFGGLLLHRGHRHPGRAVGSPHPAGRSLPGPRAGDAASPGTEKLRVRRSQRGGSWDTEVKGGVVAKSSTPGDAQVPAEEAIVILYN